MNANELIDSYVNDVAVQLPRKQRNDVAFELRALLNEELQARAEGAGSVADELMAMELLRGFGRPEDVAARYRPALTIIDPVDGRSFLRATLIGLAIIWLAGLLMRLRLPISSAGELLTVVGDWWGNTVIPSLWWPGVLVVYFGIAAWARRRPQTSDWKPRAGDRITGGRAAMVLGLLGIVCGLFVLFEPRVLLDYFFGGKAAPAAYEALTYTDTFLRGPAPWLFALITLNIPMFLIVIVQGRWSALMRRVEMVLSVVMCAVMVWTIVDGPIFLSSSSDRTAKFFMILIVAMTLIYIAIEMHRRVRPTPNLQIQA